MLIEQVHPWGVSITEATEIQRRLRERVSLVDRFGEIRLIAGVDVSVGSGSNVGYSAVVVVSFPDFEPVEIARASRELEFPYVPGYLSFREAPVVLDAFAKLKSEPDVIIVDGQGIAHPRGLGIATHLGVLLDAPTIGCGKSHLYGRYDEPAQERGSVSPLLDRSGMRIGSVVRTRAGTKPLFISPGHKMSIDSATRIILDCAPKYRLPEPIRLAHKTAGGHGV